MPQVAERVHAIQRRPAAKERRRPVAELQPSRSAASARLGGPVSKRAASPVAEIVGGLPARLRAGVESLSGIAMDDVRVHRNSSEPAKLGALAFTRGTQIHLAPGQEEHLPHEAWHVVQQKQGRVRPTTQMKGLAVNAEPALEVEADRMGHRSATTLATTGKHEPVRQPRRDSITQLKIMSPFLKQDLVVPASGASAAMADYIKRAEEFWIRDDWHPDKRGKFGNDKKGSEFKGIGFFDNHFQLLKKLGIYLIGEKHDSAADLKKTSRWVMQTANWSLVPKMHEKFVTFSPADIGKAYTIKEEPSALALEGIHARLLSEILTIHVHMNALCSPELKPAFEAKRSAVSNVTDLLYPDLRSALVMVDKYEAHYSLMSEYIKKKGKLSAREKEIYDFSGMVVKTYKKSLNALEPIAKDLEKPDAPVQKGAKPTKTFSDKVKVADKARQFLPKMLKSLMKINPITDKDEAKNISKLAAISPKWDVKEALLAGIKVRERAMVERISQAPTPLLVKVGDRHVAPLGGKITGVVEVPLGKSLEDIAKEPK